ncbi:MAG TPA: ABC transporter substrate-binding protein [Methylomirabilota bacterium]|nr:ABC transporter substrate-binding protein [Methylomirabilota bacterium]
MLVVFALTFAFLVAPIVAEAQQAAKVYRIGFLGNSTPALEAHLVAGFRSGLRDLGYEEGRNVAIEYRWADGRYDRFPALINELVASRVDVLVTAGTPATLAVKKATTAIPLVMVAVADPVGDGIVASLARPGGNITGVSSIALDLDGKRLELLRELLPNAVAIGVVWNPANASHPAVLDRVRVAAEALRLKIHLVPARTSEELADAFGAIAKERADAVVVLADRLILHHRARMMALALQYRLPGMYVYQELVEAGGLVSFGPNYVDIHRRAAVYVDKILKGAKPADLPVEQPTTFELAINLRTAKALGVTIPPSILLRVDRLIE